MTVNPSCAGDCAGASDSTLAIFGALARAVAAAMASLTMSRPWNSSIAAPSCGANWQAFTSALIVSSPACFRNVFRSSAAPSSLSISAVFCVAHFASVGMTAVIISLSVGWADPNFDGDRDSCVKSGCRWPYCDKLRSMPLPRMLGLRLIR